MRSYLSICTTFMGVLAAISFLPAGLAGMMFDAPGSGDNPATNLLAYSVLSFPLVCLAGITLAWQLYRQSFNVLAALVIWLPLVNVIAFVVGYTWLEVVYDGQFNG
ncbi:hypothetical protein [Blastopirellula marina]|uniref:Uncharacterized protein n=1 Tax=Blastopirellula marina TaxID=124 RepID=A0A2S8GUS5_9BACT|nr:hypothetical protein [Blastopirellula marina]PQO48170.1 hypothetical protein C5Y93_00365 [Blastopirellula marina]